MKRYKQFNYKDMVLVETLLAEGYAVPQMAIRIGKNKTSVYRLLKKHSNQNGVFCAESAWEKTKEVRTVNTKNYRIFSESLLEDYILEKLEHSWSPDQIAGRWKNEQKESLSAQTIYDFIYREQPKLVQLYFRRKGKKYKRVTDSGKYQIPDRRMIDERPLSVEKRKEIGHWEGDTIIGKNHKGAIVTNVERKSGMLLASKVERRTAENILDTTTDIFKDVPDLFKLSITYDNGREFAWHKLIEYNTKMTVYFAHAYSPWERGSNENTNGLLRQYIPKGTDFSTVSEKDLQRYVHLINNRPRKRLGYYTPIEIWNKDLKVALDSGF